MFPTVFQDFSPTDQREIDRIKSGRPASRAEILSRHQKEQKMNSVFSMPDQILRSRSEDLARRFEKEQQLMEARRTASSRAVRLRQMIGRLLIAAGERIRPELA